MEKELNNNPCKNAPSLAEMQRKPVYVKRDIKTTNPRRLFRNLRDMIQGSGYAIINDKTINIQKDVVGDTGFVEVCIISEKPVVGKIKNAGGAYTLDFSGAPDIAKYSFIGGILLFLIGLAVAGWVCIMGFFIAIFGMLLMLKEKGVNRIWVRGEGEVYGGQLSELRNERETQRDQIISELSISIAGESKIDPKGIKEDIDQLTRKLDALSG